MPTNFDPIVNGESSPANATTFNAPLIQLDDAIEALVDGSKELTSPNIASFANAQHDHSDAASGGQIPFDALDASGATDGDVLQVSGGAVVAAALSIPSGTPSGAVSMFAGSSAPSGWLLCYGQAVSRTTYADLFTAIGTAYGVGDGSTTFNLPDMRGRTGAGLDNMGGSSANRITDTSADSIGGAMGAETHQLSKGEMPRHRHNPSGTVPRILLTSGDYYFQAITPGTGRIDAGLENEGDNEYHNNIQPTLFLNFIIKV